LLSPPGGLLSDIWTYSNAQEELDAFANRNDFPQSNDSNTVAVSTPDMIVEPRDKTRDALINLFDTTRLEAEYEALIDAGRFAELKKGYKASNTGDLVQVLMSHSELSNEFTTYQEYAPLNTNNQVEWDNISAGWAIHRTTHKCSWYLACSCRRAAQIGHSRAHDGLGELSSFSRDIRLAQ
jgi:hypothetical protein